MSHAATNWAIKQRGLKPATKIVLWHLADCHNGHTGQCNPRQTTLAEMCEMSRSTLNLHLGKLEKLGLIRRVQIKDDGSKRQRPTTYILAFDHGEKPMSEFRTQAQDVESETQDVVSQCPKIGHGAVSEKSQKPCPKNDQNRVRNSDSIENPGIEPGIEPCVSAVPDDTHKFFDLFWEAHPRPDEARETEAFEAFRKEVEAGADPNHIIAAARAYAEEQRGNRPQFIAYAHSWIKEKRWQGFDPGKPKATTDQIIANARANVASPVQAIRQAARDTLTKHGINPDAPPEEAA